MIAMRKELAQIVLKIKSNINDLTQLYSIVRGIIEELLCACYFDNIQNLIEATVSREFHWEMQAYDYCQDSLTKTKEFFKVLTDFEKNKKFLLNIPKIVAKNASFTLL